MSSNNTEKEATTRLAKHVKMQLPLFHKSGKKSLYEPLTAVSDSIFDISNAFLGVFELITTFHFHQFGG